MKAYQNPDAVCVECKLGALTTGTAVGTANDTNPTQPPAATLTPARVGSVSWAALPSRPVCKGFPFPSIYTSGWAMFALSKPALAASLHRWRSRHRCSYPSWRSQRSRLLHVDTEVSPHYSVCVLRVSLSSGTRRPAACSLRGGLGRLALRWRSRCRKPKAETPWPLAALAAAGWRQQQPLSSCWLLAPLRCVPNCSLEWSHMVR